MNISPMPNLRIQYCEDVKIVWDEICNVHEAKKLKTRSFPMKVCHHQDARRDDMLVHINMVKVLVDPSMK
jgi:hypothetical protein